MPEPDPASLREQPKTKPRKKVDKPEDSGSETSTDLDELVGKVALLNTPDMSGALAAATFASSVIPATVQNVEKRDTYVPDFTGEQQKLYDYPPVTLLRQETMLPERM